MQKTKTMSPKSHSKTFISYKDFERTYYPDSILQRLEKTLCSELNLTKPHQHRMGISNSKTTGLIELAKPRCYFPPKPKDIAKMIGEFYKQEGYRTRIDKNFINISKKGEKYPEYFAQILESDTDYMIWINNSLLKPIHLN